MRFIIAIILTLVPVSFDRDWRFNLEGESQQTVNIPHDWSIGLEMRETENGTTWQTGFHPGGIGWYEKSFEYNPEWEGKKVSILFDGVYMDSSVWINDHFLGERPNGYVGFCYELTPWLKKGTNVLRVKVDHSRPQSARWYTGSGIYRHVKLLVDNEVRVPLWGISFKTPSVSGAKAECLVNIDVDTDRPVWMRVRMRNGKRYVATRIVSVEKSGCFEVLFTVRHPRLWSPDKPNLYTLEVELCRRTELLCRRELKVGLRKIDYDAERGLRLNNKALKLKGVCEHHTVAALGSAVPEDVLERRLKLLKEMGCNAIRTGHSTFAPEFYSVCDSLGIIVINELFDSWDNGKTPDDYSRFFSDWWKTDMCDIVRRDINHPCILFWSIGNEVKGPKSEIQKEMVDYLHELDPTRPVTQGGTDPTRGHATDYDRNFRYLDIIGFNGNGEERDELEKFHERYPDRCGIGTEMPHTYQTRSVYRSKTHWRGRDYIAPWQNKTQDNWKNTMGGKVYDIPDLSLEEVFPEEDKPFYYQSSYDNASVRISARECWQRIDSMPWMLGMFRWTGFDYLGEAAWPQRYKNSGVIDGCGFPKDHFYLYQSLWSDKPMVHILPHWTHTGKEGLEIPVVVYTNCDEVELRLNGRSLGRRKYEGEQLIWYVPYEPGLLEASAFKGLRKAASDFQRTSSGASAIAVSPESESIFRGSVTHIEVNIIDKAGTMHPYADNRVDFTIKGPGKILAVDNGDPLDRELCNIPSRKAFRGKILVYVQAGDSAGDIVLTAASDGLRSSSVTIKVK